MFNGNRQQEQRKLLNPSLHACPSLAEVALCGQMVNPWNGCNLEKSNF